MKGRRVWLAAALGPLAFLYLVASLVFPPLLLFPHHTMVGDTPVYSSAPLTAEVREVVESADARVRGSPLFEREVLGRPIFLTGGGVRWRILSLGVGGAFGLTRPLGDNIVINRSSVADDRVWNGAATAGSRTLTGVIAHERTHVLIRRRFGLTADRIYPTWLREGYCDHVGGGGTLSDAEAARLRAAGSRAPALRYHDGRKRVERGLAANGGSVDALFASALRGQGTATGREGG